MCCAALVSPRIGNVIVEMPLMFAIVDFYERGRGQMERGRGQGQLFRGRGRGQVFWPQGRGLNEDLSSLLNTLEYLKIHDDLYFQAA